MSASDEITFEILEAPQPMLAGPQLVDGVYQVEQGQPLTLDASMTLAGGSITEFAWDVNQDGYFDPGPGGNACMGDGDCRGDEICHEDGHCRLLCDNDSDCRQNSAPAQVCSIDDGFAEPKCFQVINLGTHSIPKTPVSRECAFA